MKSLLLKISAVILLLCLFLNSLVQASSFYTSRALTVISFQQPKVKKKNTNASKVRPPAHDTRLKPSKVFHGDRLWQHGNAYFRPYYDKAYIYSEFNESKRFDVRRTHYLSFLNVAINMSRSEMIKFTKDHLCNIKFSETASNSFSNYLYNDSLELNLEDLKSQDFKKFYLFDVFVGDSATHGMKVYEVVKQLLRKYHCSSALDSVERIPINYFNNKAFGDSLFNKLNKQNEDDVLGVMSNFQINDALCNQYKGRQDVTPELYLGALYKYYETVSDEPDIVSNSYTTVSSWPYIYTSHSNLNKSTNYFCSATNDAKDIADVLGDIGDKTIQQTLEPLNGYIEKALSTAIIVGDQLSIDSCVGMFGRNVSTVGKGGGWQESDL